MKAISFNEDLILLIESGKKTQTRRPIYPQPEQTKAKGKSVIGVFDYCTGSPSAGLAYFWRSGSCWNSSEAFRCPYGKVGDIIQIEGTDIKLVITRIGAERISNIDEDDAIAEGIQWFSKDGQLRKYWPCDFCDGKLKRAWQDLPRTATEAFMVLWDSIYGKTEYKVYANPWVWVIRFKKVEDDIDEEVLTNA